MGDGDGDGGDGDGDGDGHGDGDGDEGDCFKRFASFLFVWLQDGATAR